MSEKREQSLSDLLAACLRHGIVLIRKQLQLIQAEILEKLGQIGLAIGLLVAGVVFSLIALNLLASAMIAVAAALGLPELWATLLVAVIVGLIALILVLRGLAKLKATNLKLERSLHALEKGAEAVEERLR